MGLIQAKEQTMCPPLSIFSENFIPKISQGPREVNKLAYTLSICSEVCPLSCASNMMICLYFQNPLNNYYIIFIFGFEIIMNSQYMV